MGRVEAETPAAQGRGSGVGHRDLGREALIPEGTAHTHLEKRRAGGGHSRFDRPAGIEDRLIRRGGRGDRRHRNLHRVAGDGFREALVVWIGELQPQALALLGCSRHEAEGGGPGDGLPGAAAAGLGLPLRGEGAIPVWIGRGLANRERLPDRPAAHQREGRLAIVDKGNVPRRCDNRFRDVGPIAVGHAQADGPALFSGGQRQGRGIGPDEAPGLAAIAGALPLVGEATGANAIGIIGTQGRHQGLPHGRRAADDKVCRPS